VSPDWDLAEAWLGRNNIGRWEAMAPLAEYTSWKIGGRARLMAWPEDELSCARLARFCADNGFRLRVLGMGTNLLVADEGVEAVVIHTGALRWMKWEDPDAVSAKTLNGAAGVRALAGADDADDANDADAGVALSAGDLDDTRVGVTVSAGAGLPLGVLVEEATQRGLGGLEFAAGIPGSFGGALIMNAGAFGGQISDVLESVRLARPDGSIETLMKRDLNYGYRDSGLGKAGEIILGGTLRLVPRDRESVRARARENLALRAARQPLEYPSAGSVFKNPTGEGAGRFIDRSGLKGTRIGDALISEKHANFIVNLGRATAKDVKSLMELSVREVRERFGVILESEITYWE